MKNPMLPEVEEKNLEEVFKQVDKLVEDHNNIQLNPDYNEDTQLERIHLLMYMDAISDFIKSANILRSLLEVDREELEKQITHDGERTLDEFEAKLMMRMLADVIMR